MGQVVAYMVGRERYLRELGQVIAYLVGRGRYFRKI